MSHSLYPKISVVIPVFNGEAYLGQALESVTGQRFPNLEILVVDDGSTDGSEALARRIPGIQYLRQKNAGPAAARNVGISAATGDFLAFIDADDLWPEGKLRQQREYFHRNSGLDLAISRLRLISAEASAPGTLPNFLSEPFTAFTFGCALVKKSLFDKVGLLDPSLAQAEDVEWLMRAKERGAKLKFCEEVGLYYRRHPANMTGDRARAHSHLLKTLKKSLDRRRDHESKGST